MLAIDPGSSKCGLAVVGRENEGKLDVLWRGIVPVESLAEAVQQAFEQHPFSLMIVGSGTRSQNVLDIAREALPSMSTLLVDEKDTTIQARERYWDHHKRKGWRRFLPSTLQVPPEPVDDFVALILAERVLSQN